MSRIFFILFKLSNFYNQSMHGLHLMLAQLVEVLILYGMLTPHLEGRAAAALEFNPGIPLAAFCRHRQASWRSFVVRAALFMVLTPVQQLAGGAPLPSVLR